MSLILLYIEGKLLMEQLEEIRRRTPEEILAGGAAVAEKLEVLAKRNAPWTDRTGNARRTLEGFQGFNDPESYRIGICGNMPYSERLELAFGRRYAILMPTMRAQKPYILEDIRRAIGRIDGVGQTERTNKSAI